MRALLVILIVGVSLFYANREARGEDAVPGSRIIKTFDFEETKLGNYEALPMYWSKVVGRGYPAYSLGRFDHAVYRSASTSFLMETDGGSVAYRFAPPAAQRIPVNLEADYYILAFVRTSQLAHARADLAAWFADEKGNLIAATEMHSHPLAGPATAAAGAPADWQVLAITMTGPGVNAGEASKAKSLVLQVGLLQPQQLAGDHTGGLGRFDIYQQDIKGSAWFDDIVVFQLPRVSVGLPQGATGGMFTANQPVDLDLVVSDLGRESRDNLMVGLRIADSDGLVFAQEQWPAATAPDKAWTRRYQHPALPAGMYTATLDITGAQGARIASRQTRFLSLPPAASAALDHPAPEFGIGVTRWGSDPAAWNELPTILRQSGAGLVQVPAWRRDMSEEALTQHDQPMDVLLGSLQRLNIRAIATFSELPTPLAERLAKTGADKGSVFALLDSDPAIWRPYFSFLLTRYANRIDQWELGAPDEPFSGNVPSGPAAPPTGDDSDRYARLYNRTFTEISGLLNSPRLIIPWNALFDIDPRQYPGAVLDLRLPSAIKPSHLPAYIENFRQAMAPAGGAAPASATAAPATAPASGGAIIAHIAALEEGRYARADRRADFAQRVVFARSANPAAILFDLPAADRPAPSAEAAHDGARRDRPDELFLVYRALIGALGESTFAGELPVGTGLRAFLFNRHGSGTLIVWNESADTPEVALDLPLGATPRLTDLLGNIRSLTVDPGTGLTHLAVSGTPLILDQLDPRPLQLRSSFVLSTPTFPAGAGASQTEVMLSNPYADTLSGTLHLMPPRGWTADPATVPISLAPGAGVREAVTMRYPFTETAGPKLVRARLSLDGASAAGGRQFDLSFPTAVTSDTINLEGFTQLRSNGDLIIQEMVTNVSSDPLNAQAYAMVPGYPRQQRYVLGLQPGQTTVKRFIFAAGSAPGRPSAADVARALRGQAATLGLRQSDGKTLVTQALPLE